MPKVGRDSVEPILPLTRCAHLDPPFRGAQRLGGACVQASLVRLSLLCAGLLASGFGFAAGDVPSAAADPAAAVALLDAARAARAGAEESLAKARQARLEERQALAAELHQVYERLQAAETRERKARRRLASLEQRASRLREDAVAVSRRSEHLLHQALTLAGARVDASRPLSDIENALSAALDARLKRLDAALRVRVRPEAAVSRSGASRTVPVLRLGAFAAYACGGTSDTCGLLRDEGGVPRVVGPELSPALAAWVRTAARGSFRCLPVDVDGSLPERALAGRRTWRAWFAAGGLFMYPIVLVAVAGIVLAVERFGYLLAIRPPPGLVDRVLELLRRGASGEAAIEAGAASGPTARLLRAGIKAHGASQEQRETAMESALLTEAPHIERSLALIGTLAAVAPLLGLLGTVSGLIATFNTIATVGTANPRLLSGGISEAIITTQLGLMVGIPLLLMHAWLNRWAERAEAMLECDAIQVFGLPPKTHSSP